MRVFFLSLLFLPLGLFANECEKSLVDGKALELSHFRSSWLKQDKFLVRQKEDGRRIIENLTPTEVRELLLGLFTQVKTESGTTYYQNKFINENQRVDLSPGNSLTLKIWSDGSMGPAPGPSMKNDVILKFHAAKNTKEVWGDFIRFRLETKINETGEVQSITLRQSEGSSKEAENYRKPFRNTTLHLQFEGGHLKSASGEIINI